MLVPMKKAVSNKHIILLLLTLTTFKVQRGTPNQIVAHDTRDLMDYGESSQSTSLEIPLRYRKSLKQVNMIMKALIADPERKEELKALKEERVAESERKEQLEALKKKKILIKRLAKCLKEKAEKAKRLGTITEEMHEGYDDPEDYISTQSGGVNEGKQESSLHKKKSTLSDKSESIDLRQEGTSFGTMKDGEVKSPKRFLRSANGGTDGENTTKSVPLLSAVHKHKDTADDDSEQNRTLGAAGKFECSKSVDVVK